MFNKKAQSQIITTVLIILLVLAAIVIVWQVVQSTVESGAGDIGSGVACLGLNLEALNAKYLNADLGVAPLGVLTFKVTRKGGADSAEVSGLKVLVGGISQDGASDGGVNSTTPLDILDTSTTITVTETVDGEFNEKKIEVAAILSTGQTCDISATLNVPTAVAA